MPSTQKKRSVISQPSSSRKESPAKRDPKKARFDASQGLRGRPKSAQQDAVPSKKAPAKATLRDVTPEKPVVQKEKGKGKALQSDEPSSTAAPSAQQSLPELPTTFKIIVGSYEKILYGIEGTFSPADDSEESLPVPTLKPVFIFPAHVASVKAVAASPGGGKWLATGSTDEIVKVWDLRRRKEVGGLLQHVGM